MTGRGSEASEARAACAATVLRRRHGLIRYFLRRTGNWAEAEDLFGELLEVVARSELPDEPAALRRWLRARANRLLRQWWRRRQADERRLEPVLSLSERVGAEGELELAETLVDRGRPVAEEITGNALAVAVLAAFRGLPESDQQLLLQRPGRRGALRRLADLRGQSRHQTAVRVGRARRRLWALLAGDLAGELITLVGAPGAPTAASQRPAAEEPRSGSRARRRDG